MRNAFEEKLVDDRKVIDFHTHPYTCRGEYMGMYGEDFYLEPEQMPEDLGNAGISVFCGSVIDSVHRGPVGSFDAVRKVNDSALSRRCSGSTFRRRIKRIFYSGMHRGY